MDMKTKLCMFDLDGTLLDTIDDIANSMNFVLSLNNFPTYDVLWYKANVGNGARNLLLDALPNEHGCTEDTIDRLLSMYIEDYTKNSTVFTRPYDGVLELLRRLTESSIQLAVATNKPQVSSEDVVKKYFPEINFAVIRGIVPGRAIKPDPAAAFEILGALGISPEETIYVGDTEVDMIFAQRASLFSIGVLWGFRSREILEKAGAKVIIEKPEQVMDYISLC